MKTIKPYWHGDHPLEVFYPGTKQWLYYFDNKRGASVVGKPDGPLDVLEVIWGEEMIDGERNIVHETGGLLHTEKRVSLLELPDILQKVKNKRDYEGNLFSGAGRPPKVAVKAENPSSKMET